MPSFSASPIIQPQLGQDKMPYPSQIDANVLLQTACTMIESDGVANLSLNKIAKTLGVKTPSLYRYFNGRTALLRAVNEDTNRRLLRAMQPALEYEDDVFEKVIVAARLYWQFAMNNPQTYGLLFTNTIDDLRPDSETLVQGVLPFQAMMGEITGGEHSLPALRGLLALMHGFVMLVLAEQLRRGGDLSAAYETAIRAYLRGWQC